MEKIAASISLVLLAFFAQGCLQQDTVGDTTQQEQSRENGAADSIASQLMPMKGTYTGLFNDTNTILTLDVPRAPSTGNGDLGLSPQPYLAGILKVEPPISVKTVTGKPMMESFPVTNGQYVNGNDLSLTVTVNSAPTTLHCRVANQNNDLACSWYVNASDAGSADFQLTRVSSEQGLSTNPAHTQGAYSGSSLIHKNIAVVFESREDVQGSGPNQYPVMTIGGYFTKDGVVSAFKGSSYDPINRTLVIPLQGTNNPEVDCVVVQKNNLQCTWYGRQGDGTLTDPGEDEVFTLTRVSLDKSPDKTEDNFTSH